MRVHEALRGAVFLDIDFGADVIRDERGSIFIRAWECSFKVGLCRLTRPYKGQIHWSEACLVCGVR